MVDGPGFLLPPRARWLAIPEYFDKPGDETKNKPFKMSIDNLVSLSASPLFSHSVNL